jgi:ribonuclease VapC
MILDTSAILAILQSEPERREFVEALDSSDRRAMSVATFIECSIVLTARRGPDAVRDLDLFIAKSAIELVPVDLDQANSARRAHRNFGKGHHPAGLNFGDCFAYALSDLTGDPLLYKGNDFSRTDVNRHPASR